MQIFYTPDISGGQYILNEQESKHCIRVLRLKEGSFLHLTDGKGTLYKAKVVDPSPKACGLIITDSFAAFGKRNYYLHIAIAPTKNIDRFEWFLEKATEIGVDEITPMLCEHSERKQIKQERLERIIISAMKQSVKAYKPVLNNLTVFSDFIKTSNTYDGSFIAHCNEGKKERLRDEIRLGNRSVILIGPEGDFSPEEVRQAVEKGYEQVTLGESRLRTETAGVVACHSFSIMNQ